MKQNWVNNIHVEGYVFNHTLQLRESKKDGTPFIMGDINVATDENATNIVTVHFTYVTEKFSKSQKPNATFPVLKLIIDGNNTYEANGKNAIRVRIDGRAEVNDFYTREGELASPKRIGGSFVHLLNAGEVVATNPATFELDMLIYGCANKEVEDGEDYLELNGYGFNFRGDILPLNLTVRDSGGIGYFENQDISKGNPLLTKVWGNIVSTIVKKETTVESAFGAPSVNVTTRTIRSWDVVGAAAEPMEFDDESTITKDELKAAMNTRTEYLADVKKRQEEYEAQKSGKSGFPTQSATTVAVGATAKVTENEDDFPF